MATFTGNDGALYVGTKQALQVKSFSVDMKSDTIETSVMGTDVRTYTKGVSSFSGSADIFFDTLDWDTSPETLIWNPTDSGAPVGTGGVSAKFYIGKDVGGVSTADTVFYGDVIVTGYSIKSSFDGMVEATVSFQGTGGVTYSTGSNVAP
jgi:hypothetical protein